jgi:hypothetical protein
MMLAGEQGPPSPALVTEASLPLPEVTPLSREAPLLLPEGAPLSREEPPLLLLPEETPLPPDEPLLLPEETPLPLDEPLLLPEEMPLPLPLPELPELPVVPDPPEDPELASEPPPEDASGELDGAGLDEFGPHAAARVGMMTVSAVVRRLRIGRLLRVLRQAPPV